MQDDVKNNADSINALQGTVNNNANSISELRGKFHFVDITKMEIQKWDDNLYGFVLLGNDKHGVQILVDRSKLSVTIYAI